MPNTYVWKGTEYPMGVTGPGEQQAFMKTQPGYKEWNKADGQKLLGQVMKAMNKDLENEQKYTE